MRIVKKLIALIFGTKNTKRLRSYINRLSLKFKLISRGVEYRDILNYVDIEGWLSLDEAVELYSLAKGVPDESPVVVEIGSWLGKSSLVLAKGMRKKEKPTLFCIDPFNADGDEISKTRYSKYQSYSEVSLKDRFLRNMRKNNVAWMIKLLHGYSYDFVADFSHEIDLLFIDGNHAYEAVLGDYSEWYPMLKTGGIIAFHDVVEESAHPGPLMVVQQKLVSSPLWKNTRLVDKLFIATRTDIDHV